MADIARRDLIGALAAGGAALGAASMAAAQSRDLEMKDLQKDTDVACLYHCDFGNDQRYSAMLRNINNHLSVYNFDPFAAKIVIVAHSAGIKYHLTSLAGTPWENDPAIEPDLEKRMEALAKYGVEVYLCKITFQLQKIDLALAKPAPYIRMVPSGVATAAALQGKGFAYLKVG
jgi:intracellular sulfur oxidation DsrE/DsrF family protein